MKSELVAIILFVVMVGTAWALNCGICGSGMYRTGDTKFIGAHFVKEYKCYNGHTVWME